MSSIKNKNLLFLGAAIIIAATYSYYAFNTTPDVTAVETDAKAVIGVPVPAPVNVVESAIAIPAAIKPSTNEAIPPKESVKIEEGEAAPEGEQE